MKSGIIFVLCILVVLVSAQLWDTSTKVEYYKGQTERLRSNQSCYNNQLIRAYNEYYISTERLLGTLEEEYGWMDTELAPDYYYSRDILDEYLNCFHE